MEPANLTPPLGRDTPTINPDNNDEHGHNHVTVGVENTIQSDDTGSTGNDGNNQRSGLKALFLNVPRRKIVVLLFCTLAIFLSTCAFALIAPFFPMEAQKKGMDLTTIGIVFSSYELVGFAVSPLIGNYLSQIGTKFVYLSGLFVCGVSSICFGVLNRGPDGTVFTVMCILCRCFEALGTSAFRTAGMAIASSEFPDHIGTVNSILNLGMALGLMTGPVVGGALFELGGYELPFFVIAGLSICDAVLIYFFLPGLPVAHKKREKSMLSLLRSVNMIAPMLCVLVGNAGIGIFDAVFATRVKPFKLSATVVGSVYLIASGVFALMCPIWGRAVDKIKNFKELLIIVALSLFGLAFWIIGPTPLLPFLPFKLWSMAIGFVLIGASFGGIIIPSLACMMKSAHDQGHEKNVDTHALVSGLYACARCLGQFIGPMAGSAIVQNYGFPDGFTYFGFTSFSVMVLYLVYFVIRSCHSGKTDGEEP